MAKLILSLDDVHLSDYSLTKARITIGRRSSNDIHLDNLAVSGEHAVITKAGNDFYVEDLDSTNGTLVNNEVTKKHLLQHDDEIELGKFKLKYLNDAASSTADANSIKPAFEKTMLMRPSALKSRRAEASTDEQTKQSPDEQSSSKVVPSVSNVPPVASVSDMVGRVQVLNGTSSGRELVLNKALTTLGKTGVQVAVITKRPNGYFITHVEGKVLPIVNGVSAGLQAFALHDHDVIELAGVKMEFYLTKS